MNVWLFILLLVGVPLVSLVVFVVLFVIFAILSSKVVEENGEIIKKPWQFCEVPKGETVQIIKGSDLKAIIPNVDGHKMSGEKDLDGRRWLVRLKETDEDKAKEEMREALKKDMLPGTRWVQSVLWDRLGIRFVSWFYPQVQVLIVTISANRLKSTDSMGPGTSLKDRIERDKEEIYALRFLVPRPLVVEGVLLAGDGSRINLLIQPTFRQVIPSLPVFYYKGKFFRLLDAFTEAGIVSFFATHLVAIYKGEGEDSPLKGQFAHETYDPSKAQDQDKYKARYESSHITYSHWLRMGVGPSSALQRHLSRFNASPEFYDALKKAKKKELVRHLDALLGGRPKPIPSFKPPEYLDEEEKQALSSGGILPSLGFVMERLEIIDREPHEDSKDLAEAVRAEATERQRAKGVRQKAYGQSDADKVMAEGHAALYGNPVEALTKLGVSPDVAARVHETAMRAKAIGGKDSKVTTYIESGSGPSPSVMVPAQQSPTPPAPPDSSTTPPTPPPTGSGTGT